MDLAEVLEAYQTHLASYAKPNTIKTVRYHTRRLLLGLPPDLTRQDVDRWVARRRAVGDAGSSINANLRTLRAALLYAEDIGLIPKAPKIRLLKVGRNLVDVVDLGQLEDLFEVAPKVYDPLPVIFALAAYAGLRHQEILHLTRADIVWPHRDGTPGSVKVTAKNGWTPKSYHERVIPIEAGGRLHLLLKEWWAYRGFGRQDGDLRTRWNEASEWLFPYKGRPLQDVTTYVMRAFRLAGLLQRMKRPGLHSLRRSWATQLLAKGVDIETVRQLGGWADLETVQRYVTSDQPRKVAAVAGLWS